MTLEHETRTIEELIAELPPPLQLQVRDFVEFLLSKQRQGQREKEDKLRQGQTSKPKQADISAHQIVVLKKKKQDKLRQDWANAVDYQDHTSVELQHLAQSWREQ